ncbi:MAG: tetratricopeptide repeat protein [Bacteroidota bacterium]
MPLICATGAFYLYKGVRKLNIDHAFFVVPLLLFQTYFFSISRNAETEPLAVTIIALGFYFLVHRKWFWFAVIGGLIPLARLELSVMLIFWVWYLIREKQYKYIIYLGIPLVLWNIAGGIITGDYLHVVNSTIGADNSSNRYGHTSFGHYFQRFIYVVGPVIYLFFMLGLVRKIKALKWDAFILMQFVFAFLMYVIFSWKLNIGNAAGFLRNLTPLTPLVALLALEGFNYFWYVSTRYLKPDEKKVEIPEKSFKTYSDEEIQKLSTKKRNQYFGKLNKWKAKAEKIEKEQLNKKRLSINKQRAFLAGFVILLIGTVYYYHSYEIKNHHSLQESKNYINLMVISGTAIISFISVLMYYKNILSKKISGILAVIIGFCSLGFTLITEPPNANMSPERKTVEEIASIYQNTYLNEKIAHVNHHWFYWSHDLNRWDSLRFRDVTLEDIKEAKEGAICVYENHYSHRLKGDVPKDYFKDRIDWIRITQKMSSDRTFKISIFQKTDSTIAGGLDMINEYIASQPNDPASYFYRAQWYQKSDQTQLAIEDFNTVIDMDSTFVTAGAYFKRGLIHFKNKTYKPAIKDFKQNAALVKSPEDAHFNTALSYFNLNQKDSALIYLDKTIQADHEYEKVYNLKLRIYKSWNNTDQTLNTLKQIEKIKPGNEKVILNIAQIYYDKKDWKNTISTLSRAIKVNPKNANSYYVRGICHQNVQKNKLACKDWEKAASLENPNAVKVLKKYCQ